MKKRKEDPPQAARIATGDWTERARVVRRSFPGPRGANEPLRVAMTREAYAEISAHARESLESEVCGILAGELCEDDEGEFVDVQVALRGTSTRQGRGHVTFTQETWNAVHSTLEREHPDLQIVGWYHTHPGFGVEFSDMDAFIQRHFFPLASQMALVMDPLGGDVAVGTSGPTGMQYVSRFWVEGREHRAKTPASRQEGLGASAASVQSLEVRVDQLVAAVHDLRASLSRTLALLAFVVVLGTAAAAGYVIYRSYTSPLRPPEGMAYLPLPVRIEGKPAVIGIAIVNWEIPPELLAVRPGAAPAGKADDARPATPPVIPPGEEKK